MLIPVVKVLAAISAALILIWIASRRRYFRRKDGRVLRSLPGNLVQEIADRLGSPSELTAFLGGFFGVKYQGAEHPAENPESFRKLLPGEIPEEEFADLVRTAGAIEPDALLAYACPVAGRDRPAVITVCRNEDGNGLLVGVFLPD